MARRVGIFYHTIHAWSTRLHEGSTVTGILIPGDPGGRMIYIRMEIAKSTNLVDALDEAKPLSGENVMNTHYIDPE